MGLKDGRNGDGMDALEVVRGALEALQNIGKRQPSATKIERSMENAFAGARVAKYMVVRGLTQKEFAEMAHISERTLRRLLRSGNAGKRTWIDVAKAIGTTPEDLLETGH